MATRRTTAPRKRPATQAAIAPVSDAAQQPNAVVDEDGDGASLEHVRAEVMREFESALRKQPGIDQEGLDLVLSQFRDAVSHAEISPSLELPTTEKWSETLRALEQDNLLSGQQGAELARHFNESLEGSLGEEARLALEFAQKLESEGQEAALVWLEAQDETPATERVKAALAGSEGARHGYQVTQSRSRRLRGPPKA